MATINGVRLDIDRMDDNRSHVNLSYRICFSQCEAMAGSVFVENVTLRGDDPIWDDHLLTLHNRCIKAKPGCIRRKFSRIVSNKVLDEDPDTIIFGWVIGNKDEVYARVRLTPFSANGSQGDSNVEKAHFGPAG
ncbi:MAG TPA: hypothetical protein ENJ33_02335 [Thiothrix sp.]|nr:hypothetical protein [Thiothrix sp.]